LDPKELHQLIEIIEEKHEYIKEKPESIKEKPESIKEKPKFIKEEPESIEEETEELVVVVVGDTDVNWNFLQEELECIARGNLLRDSHITYYMEYLSSQFQMEGENVPKFHFFGTNFFSSLVEGHISLFNFHYDDIQKWVPKDVQKMEKLFIPIYSPGHWSLALINIKDKTFEYYDSLGSSISCSKILLICRNFWMKEMTERGIELTDLNDWEDVFPDAPKQMNGRDCGVFVCQYCFHLSKDPPVLCFSQRDIPRLRMEMAENLRKFLGVPERKSFPKEPRKKYQEMDLSIERKYFNLLKNIGLIDRI